MKFKPRQFTRTLELDLGNLLHFRPAVEEVFNLLTPKTIDVIRPDDKRAISLLYTSDEPNKLDRQRTRQVRIGDWFACVCQRIRREDESDAGSRSARPADTLAWYSYNFAHSLLLWKGLLPPVGPAGVSAEIVLTFAAEQMLIEGQADAFRCIIAHELAHALDFMLWVVPAFRDWDAFCESANAFGGSADEILDHYEHQAMLLDQYGSHEEFATLERYWPDHARKWFTALRSRKAHQ